MAEKKVFEEVDHFTNRVHENGEIVIHEYELVDRKAREEIDKITSIAANPIKLEVGEVTVGTEPKVTLTQTNEHTILNFVLPNTVTLETTSELPYVDLGLPSGTQWAKCNLGAIKPNFPGESFSWGETEPKLDYTWGTYRWISDEYIANYFSNEVIPTAEEITKYKATSSLKILDVIDDAAFVNLGEHWRIPTVQQMNELITNCVVTYTQNGNYKGFLFTGPNNNTIFLPAVGNRYGITEATFEYWHTGSSTYKSKTALLLRGNFNLTYGCYWCNATSSPNDATLYANLTGVDVRQSIVRCTAWALDLNYDKAPSIGTSYKNAGVSIRPVYVP